MKYSTLRLGVKQSEEAEGERPGRDRDVLAENRRLRAEIISCDSSEKS